MSVRTSKAEWEVGGSSVAWSWEDRQGFDIVRIHTAITSSKASHISYQI
jgi:hypothetical protein